MVVPLALVTFHYPLYVDSPRSVYSVVYSASPLRGRPLPRKLPKGLSMCTFPVSRPWGVPLSRLSEALRICRLGSCVFIAVVVRIRWSVLQGRSDSSGQGSLLRLKMMYVRCLADCMTLSKYWCVPWMSPMRDFPSGTLHVP